MLAFLGKEVGRYDRVVECWELNPAEWKLNHTVLCRGLPA